MDKFIASIFGHFNLDVMAKLLFPKEKKKEKKKGRKKKTHQKTKNTFSAC